MFSVEFGWRPGDVWAMEYGDFWGYAKYLDQVAEARKKQAQERQRRQRRTGRRRLNG